LGYSTEARQAATSALALSSGSLVIRVAAFAFASAGDAVQAQRLVDQLNQEFPLDTMLQYYVIPSTRAQIELRRGDASKAIEILQVSTPYELGVPGLMIPVYVRGEAYLQARNGPAAAVEFQKMLDHRTLSKNSATTALAHLGMARARQLSGDTAGSRAAYQDFLALWKDADPDIPVLREAKAEYAKLQ
jgi:hypothetical protein